MARDLFEEAGIVMAPAAKQGGRDLFEEFGVAAPAPDRPERSALRGAADVALEVVSGGIKGIKFISDAAGADNVVSRGLGAADDAVKGLQSPLAQYEDRQVSQIMREAEDKGGLEQAGQALRAAGVAPVRMSLGALATGAPVIAASMIPGVREASWGARLAAMGTLGATQGAGVVKSSIYEGVRDRALQEGLAQDEAQAVAERAQRYTENPGLIAGGAALGAAASATGFERSVAQILGRKAAEQAVARSAVGSVAKGVVKEAPLEATQGGQERYATNVATDRAGFETPAFRGVVGSATLEGTLSAPGGAIGGALDYAGSRRQPPAEGPDPAAEPAATPVADQPSARPTLSAETVQATAQARLDALERKANGTPEQTVVGPDGASLVVPGEQPQYLNLEERRERTFLRENLGEPQRLADGLGVTVGTAATPEARLVELDLLSQVRGLSEPERAEFDALLAQFDQEDADGGDGAVPPMDPGADGSGAADDAAGMGAGVGVDGRPEPGVVGSGPAAGTGGEAVPPGRDAERAAVAPAAPAVPDTAPAVQATAPAVPEATTEVASAPAEVTGAPAVQPAPITREAKLPLGSTVYDGQGNPWRVQNRRSGILTLQPIVGGTPDTKAAQRFVIDQDKAPANSGARVEPLFLQAPAQGPQAGSTPTGAEAPVGEAPASGESGVSPAYARRVFRGSGRKDKGSVYNGGSTPILGDAAYYALDEKTASKFGPNVEARDVSLRNPLVIDSDQKWRALTREAGDEETAANADAVAGMLRDRLEVARRDVGPKQGAGDAGTGVGGVPRADLGTAVQPSDGRPGGAGDQAGRAFAGGGGVAGDTGLPRPEGGDAAPQGLAAPAGDGGGARPVVLQNRDRSGVASVTQMQSIAANPDPRRLSFSRDFGSGAPVVFSNFDEARLVDAQLGREDTITDSQGRQYAIQYAVIEADEVVASNAADGTPNDLYEDSDTPGLIRAVAGNGRMAGLQEAFRRGTAAGYAQGIAADTALHGIDPAVIDAMSNPVLVRIMRADDVTPDIGDRSNVSGAARLNPVEQARTDMARVNLEALDFTEAGDPTPAAVKAFVAGMPEAERSELMTRDGAAGRQAIDRLMAATFAKAYGDERLVELYAQATDPDARNVLSAMAQAAGAMARLEGMGDLDVRSLVIDAANMAVNAARNGVSLAKFAQTPDITLAPEVRPIAETLAANARSAKRMAEALRSLADLAYSEATKESADMFGEVPRRTRGQVIEEVFGGQRREGGADAVQNAGRAGVDEAGAAGQGDAPGQREPAGNTGQPQGERSDRPADGQDDAFGLTSYTLDELAQRDAELEQTQADQQAEQDRRASAPPADDFVLSGSDRPADQAAARGQMELAEAPATEAAAPVDPTQLERDYRTYPTQVRKQIADNGASAALYRAAGARSADAFSTLPMDDQAAAYVKFVEAGGAPASGLPQDYNAWVMAQERDAENRRLQGDPVVRQANGKAFASRATAERFMRDHDLSDTHEARETVGGFELRRLPEAQRPSAIRRLAERQAADPETQRQERAFARAEEIGTAADAAVMAYENGESTIEEFEAALDAVAPAAAAKPKRTKPAATDQRIADYFAPGNIVPSYGGGFDRVLEFRPGEDGKWSVKVEAVRKDGDAWVADGGPRDARWHSTAPDQRALTKGPEERAPADEAPKAEAAAGKQATPISDFGSKIGGARKDTSTPTGPRGTKQADDRPGWRKRYSVSQIAASSRLSEVGRWTIHDERVKDRLGQAKQVGRDSYATKEEAEAAIPLAEVARNHRAVPASTKQGESTVYEIVRDVTDRKRVKVVDQQFVTREDALRYMIEHAVEIIETKTSFGEEILPTPETVMRKGPPRRTADSVGEDFQRAFGFRGVEFGNWNNQAERQEVMNHAYDGLMDLAEVLGIPPKAIGLDGELALAFGARGNGLSGARAHYEPDYAVINLTKMHGAGSLAHEWLHAVDHYFARQDGKAKSARVKNKRGDDVFPTQGTEQAMASHGFGYKSAVRQEVRDAYKAVIETMYRKAEQFVEDTQRADRFVANARKDVQTRLVSIRQDLAEQKDPRYWKRKNAPASAEQLAAFDEISRKIVDGEMLETTLVPVRSATTRKTLGSMRWSNDALERISAILKDVRGRGGFDSTNQSGVLDRLRQEMGNYSQRLKMLADAQSAEVKSRKVPTEYAMAAKSIDQGRASDYWSTPHEMAARAFQSYVLDKIAEQGGESDFLTYGPENVVVPTPWGWKRPFPAGAERKEINAAFDALFATIQTRETDTGVAMFSRSEETRKAYEARIDALFAGEKAARVGAKVLDRSDMLDMLGLGGGPVHLAESKVLDGRDNHPRMTAEAWKKIPQWIEDPAAVFESDTVSRRLTFIAPETVGGAPVIVIVEPNVDVGAADLRVHILVNAYDKDGGKPPFGRWMRDGLARYVDQKKFPTILAQAGLQLPSTTQNKPGTRKILTEKNLAGYRRAAMSRGAGPGLSVEAATSIAAAVRKAWANGPEVVVVADMADQKIPQAVRDADAEQRSRGATGEPEGFFYGGKVYLVAGQLATPADVVRVLSHEALGHYGLRGLFGDRLAGILDQIGLVRRTEVMAKRQEYGLPDTTAGRRVAAEEVLSVMAQTNPQLGFVRRAVAAIRTWLRGLGLDLRMTDDEIIRSFILPARQWVQRGGARPAAGEVSMSRGEQVHAEIDEDTEALLEEFGLPAGSREEAQRALAAGDRVFVAAEMDEQAIEVLSVRGLEGYTPDQMLVLRRGDGMAFSRSAMKSATANMDRGLKALAQAVMGRTTVHRAMFRNGLGWVDFVWGDEGTVKSDGRTKGAKGLSHIVEARMRKDGLTEKEAIGVLSEMVRAIAAGGETKRRQVGRSVSATFEHDGYRVALVKTHGANAWVVTAFEIGPDARPAGYATAAPTQTAASLSRDGMGAGPVAPGDTVPSLGRATRGDSTNRGGTAGAGSRDSMAPGREDGNAMFSRSTLGDTPPPSTPPANRWQRLKARAMELTSPEALDKLIYELQDKFIDLKRIRDHIAALGGTVNDLNDAYLGEELYHKRLAKRTQDFLNDEVKPLLAELRATGTGIQDFERFLHARHAPEANRVLAERNPNQEMIDARRAQLAADVRQLELDLQRATARGTATKAIEQALDTAREQQRVWGRVQAFRGTEAERNALSGMSDDEAQALMDGLPPGRRQVLESLAARVDAINGKTLDALQSYGLMDRASLDAWRATYQFYVPLHRDEAHADSGAHPIGQGYLSKGDAAKRRTGSTEQVTNILSHVVMQREAALTRGEKARVGKQLYLLAAQNPDPSLWQVDKPPKIRRVDEATGTVVTMVDPLYKQKPNVLMVRIGGKDAAIVFNERNPQAMRLAEALRNLDVGDLHFLVGMVAKGTRWFASVNTQYNPIFGLINFARDLGAGVLNLSTTPLAGKERQVAHGTFAAMRAIYRDTRGKAPANAQWARLWQQMQDDGGTTGYRDLFVDANDRAKKLQRELGALDRGQASKAAHAVLDWLSAYNETMENAVRLAAYKEALDMGMSRPRAASLAKNLTVNFNRKGRQTREAGAFYAFFNAAIQGNTRMFQTLLGPAGKKIMLGGVMLGAINTLLGMAVMGGGDEDEWEKIPEFIKERSIIIPVGRQDYVTIPMPLGFHVLPNIGRTAVEMMLGDPDKTPGKMVGKLLMTLAEAFNPLGSSQDLLQMAAPTVIDPVAALTQNRDWTGRPIYRPDYNSLDPTPGPQRAKDTASTPSRVIAELLNMATGGTEYRPGAISWTPDQIDYVFGQLTGGLGREILKLNQTIVAPITGEELPAYKIPLVGRIYGNTRGPSAQSERFYENVREINEIENELRGRAKAGQDVQEVLREEPLARLIGAGNAAEQQIRRLREQRRAVSERAEPGYRNEVAEINERIGGVMAVLSRQVGEAKRAETVE